jgi:hypothetical protein
LPRLEVTLNPCFDLEALREDDFGILTGLGLFLRGAVVTSVLFLVDDFDVIDSSAVFLRGLLGATELLTIKVGELIDSSAVFLRGLLGVTELLTIKVGESPLFLRARRSLLVEHNDLLDCDLNSPHELLLTRVFSFVFRGDGEL